MEQPSVPKMSKLLITLAFEKAENEIGSSVKTRLANHLAEILLDDYKYPISGRTIRDYYTYYVETNERVGEDLKPKLIRYLCNYLGYEDYVSFEAKNPSDKKTLSPKSQNNVGLFAKNKNSIVLIFSALALSGMTYFGFIKEEQNCMVWRQDHYEQNICSRDSNEKPLEELILKRFRKVVSRDSLIKRRANNQELWYVKSNDTIEFFTYHGYHPINNKPLKNVTDYIFKTYVLDKMNDSVPTEP